MPGEPSRPAYGPVVGPLRFTCAPAPPPMMAEKLLPIPHVLESGVSETGRSKKARTPYVAGLVPPHTCDDVSASGTPLAPLAALLNVLDGRHGAPLPAPLATNAAAAPAPGTLPATGSGLLVSRMTLL